MRKCIRLQARQTVWNKIRHKINKHSDGRRRAPSKTIIIMKNETCNGKMLLSDDKNWMQAGTCNAVLPTNLRLRRCMNYDWL